MKILIGCEESGVITSEFRKNEYEAYSCDLLPTRGNPDFHIQDDIMNVIPIRSWDLIILHPDCTAMAVSGNRWYGEGMNRNQERKKAIEWTVGLWELAKKHSKRMALENPVSVIFQYLNYDNLFYVHPWQFGHGEVKKTGFATIWLPELQPTDVVAGRAERIWRMPPSETRKRDRSQTYHGIAKAIVNQWGGLL